MQNRIKFVGQFSDPQVELQMIEIVKTSQSLLDKVYIAQDSILNISSELETKETKVGASQKALQAESNAKQYSDGNLIEAKSYSDDKLFEAKSYIDEQIGMIETYPPLGGATNARPVDPKQFSNYFDMNLGKPIWWDGTKWVDANGDEV